MSSRGKTITEEKLGLATLDGFPCKGYAWVETTQVEVLDEKGRPRLIDGIRTWHGKAVIDRDRFPVDHLYNRAIEYQGILEDGEAESKITGLIYVSSIRGIRTPGLSGDGVPSKLNVIEKLFIDFTGAGNPRRSAS